jgi:hypothetical protein
MNDTMILQGLSNAIELLAKKRRVSAGNESIWTLLNHAHEHVQRMLTAEFKKYSQ